MVIPFLKPPNVVIAYLQDPRERFWGLVRHLDASGLVMQGIDLNSFDDWLNSAVRGEGRGQLSTVFYPLMRVEKVLVDSSSIDIPSLAEQFEKRLGRSLFEFVESDG
jgi:hypothetical protein